eukprot:jgi/Hompol1/3994/HPOL_000690-RA
MHLKQRPYKCSSCGSQFARKSDLARHEKQHRCRNFACPSCHLEFQSASALGVHLGSDGTVTACSRVFKSSLMPARTYK